MPPSRTPRSCTVSRSTSARTNLGPATGGEVVTGPSCLESSGEASDAFVPGPKLVETSEFENCDEQRAGVCESLVESIPATSGSG